MIIEQIEALVRKGTVIPKPEAKADFVVKGWGVRRGERALVYLVPNHKDPSRPYEKGVTLSEFERAYQRVMSGEDFDRKWFEENMSACAAEGGCNFTTIGGLFQLLRIVEYERGRYYRRETRT